MTRVLAMVLAGGEGKRLMPLTVDRAKPAVPFGGNYRLIDFALSNLVNAGFRRIVVLTQYKSHSLDRHIAQTWHLSPLLGNYVTPVPAQMRRGPYWFSGSADAIYQNLNLLYDERPDIVAVFGADHIYRMDPRQMVDQHIESGAAVTVAALRAPLAEADQFGVIETAADGQTITAFREKPSDPKGLPDAPDQVYASMGNYVFSTEALISTVSADAADSTSKHDMGGSIVPALVESGAAHVYDFSRNEVPGASAVERGYWRDVGTISAYWKANMDLVKVVPDFDLYNPRWPLRTWTRPLPPAKFVFADPGDGSGHARMGIATDSLVSEGCIVSGGRIDRTVLSPQVRVNSFAYVEESIILDSVDIGRHCRIRRAIIDKGVHVPPNTEIGYDPEADARRFTVSDGIVVVPKGYQFVQ